MRLLSALLDFIVPLKCVICGDLIDYSSGTVCGECLKSIPMRAGLNCWNCLRNIPTAGLSTNAADETELILKNHCKKCFLGKSENYGFIASASSYANPKIRLLVSSLKYKLIKNAAVSLAEVIEPVLKEFSWFLNERAVLVPIPLHASRREKRGFNHAELIAERIAEKIGCELSSDILIRIKNTIPQYGLSKNSDRAENVKECFHARPEKITALIKYKNIFLVDDIATSGATLWEASGSLANHGIKTKGAFVVASAIDPRVVL